MTSTPSMATLMRQTKADLAEQVIALHQRVDQVQRDGIDVELAEALMASEERLKTFIEFTPAPITLKDTDGRYILVNTSFCERRGVTHEQVLGKTVYDVYPDAAAKRIEEHDRTVTETGKSLEFDFNSVAPDGSAHNYVAIRFPVFGTNGDVAGVGGVNLDITERRKAEEDLRTLNEELERRVEERTLELRANEQLLRSFLDNSVAPITLKGLDGRILLANKRFARNRGLNVADVIGKTNRDLFSPEMARTFEDHDRQVIAAGEPMEFEVESEDVDGVMHAYLMVRFPVTDTTGEIIGTGLVTTDISARKKADEELADQTRLLRLTLDNIGHGIVVLDPDSRHVLWNSLASKMTGITEEMFERRISRDEQIAYQRTLNYGELFEPEYVRFIDDFERRLKNGERDLEASFERPGLEPDTWTKVTWRSLPDGSVVRLFVDVTEQRNAEIEIKKQREILEDLFENVAQGLAAYDGEARVITWNKKYQEFLVLKDEDIYPGCPVWDLVMIHADRGTYDASERQTLEARVQDRIDQLMSGEVVHFDYTNVDGIPMEAVSAPRPQGGFVVTYADITDRKMAETEIIRARDEADAANRAKSEFLSSMSHELRTPLNAIIGFSEFVAEDEDDPLTDEQQECMGQVMKAGRHLLALIDEVLDLSKIETGALALSLEPVAIPEVAAECVELTVSMAGRRGIGIKNLVGEADSPPIEVDRIRFKQVLLNFLSNAVKYNREDGAISITQDRMPDGRVRISVTDTGSGIAEHRLANLFEPFDRLGAENSEIEGTGIGLTITKRLVEMMDGEIGVESTVGEGTTFWAAFPAAARASMIADSQSSEALIAGSAGEAQGTVLYVEDNPANLDLMRKIIGRRGGISLIDAPTAELGIELALSTRPNLIIMDINLPGMNGIAALAELRKMAETRDIPVIALSASAMPTDVDKGRRAGFRDYLTKPLESKHLLDVLDRVLSGA